MSYTVFYLNPGATAEVLDIVREALPPGWRLTTPRGPDISRELAECDFLLIPGQPLFAEHLAAAPRLLMVQHQGVGYERIDLAACRARKIPVCLTPEGTSTGVAEHTILLILAFYKQLVKAAVGVREGRWMEWELRGGSFELCGKTLGIIGMGRIGLEVALRASAFDAFISYYDPFVKHPFENDFPPGPWGENDLDFVNNGLLIRTVKKCKRCESLEELLACSDIVTLHVPVTADTRKFVNAELLAKFKPGAILVNTARGALVDEPALVAALDSGQLRGAALDVLAQEPPDPSNPLLHMDNVLVTPHISAGTRDALKAKMRAAFANMVLRTRGELLWHVVPELADLFEGTP